MLRIVGVYDVYGIRILNSDRLLCVRSEVIVVVVVVTIYLMTPFQ